MCGISGFLTPSDSKSLEEMNQVIARMSDQLGHRGPDDSGTWCDQGAGAALGHRRLAVLDLSDQGHQPMLSPCGRLILIYNGEIYNCPQIRRELEAAGSKFRGQSDTEILLEAIRVWGMEATLPKLRGMFAFALWNRDQRKLTLVRDRIGIKPLYYGWSGCSFLFGSELKSLTEYPGFQQTIAPESVSLLLRHSYIPAPYTIYQGINKLQPGMILELDWDTEAVPGSERLQSYWSFWDAVETGIANPFRGTFSEATDRLEELLQEAIRLRLLSDVPVGAFLSGGIDSSLIVALMQRELSQPIRTFTIGFTEHDFDEAPYAHRISEYIGTEHTELCVTPFEACDALTHIASIYDEPFADMSQIPTVLVSKLAREHVTVSLSGDGGDELFCGYNRYFHLGHIWDTLQRIPARQFAGKLLENASHSLKSFLSTDRLERMADAAQTKSPEEFYALMHRHWNPSEVVSSPSLDPSEEVGFGKEIRESSLAKLKWMAFDTTTYLPDDILTKLDRASMSVSLEARVPMLDHHIVEFAWTLPTHYRYEKGVGKKILRELLTRYVPPKMFDRPKVGFGIPIDQWLRGDLREWADDLLSEQRLNEHGFLQSEPIRKAWEAHCSGEVNSQYLLWTC